MNEHRTDTAPAVTGRQADLELMLARAASVVVRASASGVLLEVTPTVTTLLDWRPAELIGTSLGDLVHPDDAALVHAAEAELVAGRAVRISVRLRCRDRRHRAVEISMRPDLDGQGVVHGHVAGWRADRPQASGDAVGEPVDDDPMLALVVDHTREVLTVVDPDGRIVWSTTAVRDLFGWGPAAILGRAVVELIHPEDFSAALPLLQAAFRFEDPVTPAKDILARLVSPSGGHTWASIRLVPVTDMDGNLVCVVVSARGVDELFASRAQLATERALMRASLDSMLDPHVVLVPVRDRRGEAIDFVITHANPAACASRGTDLGSLLGSRLSEIASTLWPNGLFALIVRAADTSTTVSHDGLVYDHDDPSGVTRRFAMTAVPSGGRVCVSWRELPAG